MTTAPTTIGNIDHSIATASAHLTAALERIDLTEARVVSERIDALLGHRLAQMALHTP